MAAGKCGRQAAGICPEIQRRAGVCQAGGDNPHRYERLAFCVKDSLGTCFGFRERPDISEALFTEVNYLVI